jgi:hypothetical protein
MNVNGLNELVGMTMNVQARLLAKFMLALNKNFAHKELRE